MEGINKGVKQAEKDLEGLEKCCGLCVCPCHRSVDLFVGSFLLKQILQECFLFMF